MSILVFTNNSIYISCRECYVMPNLPTELNEDTMLEFVNKLISERTGYGMREVFVNIEKFTVIAWSNGGANWYVINKDWISVNNSNVHVDANQVVIPLYVDQVRKIIDKLDDLPLYANSFEGQRALKL